MSASPINTSVHESEQDKSLAFKTANFSAKTTSPLHLATAQALYYFFSNQFEQITEDHYEKIAALLAAEKQSISAFLKPPRVINSKEGLNPEVLAHTELAGLLADCQQNHFAFSLVAQAVNNGSLRLSSPFSDNSAFCQGSYITEEGVNYLRFTDADNCFFLLQSNCSADGIYFPLDNVLLILNQASQADVSQLQLKLLSHLRQFVSYAQANKRFGGIIASNHSRASFFYDAWPVLIELQRNQAIFTKIPALISRKGQDFIDLKTMFRARNCVLSDPESGYEDTLANSKWFIHIGNPPTLRHQYRHYLDANRYLLSKANLLASDGIRQQLSSLNGCFPLVWISLQGQQPHWLEQVEGYAYCLKQLQERYPNLGVIIDGSSTLPISASATLAKSLQADQQLAEQLIALLNPSIKAVSVVGETSINKVFIGNHIDFFISDYADGSLYVSQLLGKPGFCHTSKVLAKNTLPQNLAIHPHRRVFLLPAAQVTDKYHSDSPLQSAGYLASKLVMGLLKSKKKPLPKSEHFCYSIDKNNFWQFIELRLPKVLAKPPNPRIKLFIEPSFSIHPDVRLPIKMANHGNVVEVFPTLAFPKTLLDIAYFDHKYLKQNIIYGLFGFDRRDTFGQACDYLIWLGNPLTRVQLHAVQFIKNAEASGQVLTLNKVLTKGHKALDNYYTRLISGKDVAFGECTEETFEAAIENLNKSFVFIGINEQQADSYDRLCALMDWDRSLFADQLATSYSVDEEAFAKLQHLIRPLIQYDLRLYKAALMLITRKQRQAERKAAAASE